MMNARLFTILISFVLFGLSAHASTCDPVKDQAGSVEFTRTKLVFKNAKSVVTDLPFSQPAPNCTSLKKSKLPNHVVIEFWGGYEGTSQLIDTKYWGLIDLAKPSWSVKPTEIEERVKDAEGEDTNALAEIKEVGTGKDYHVEMKDLDTGKTETLRLLEAR